MTQVSRPEPADDLGSTWEEAQKGDPNAWEALFKRVLSQGAPGCAPQVESVDAIAV